MSGLLAFARARCTRGRRPTARRGRARCPLHLSTAFVFDSTEHAAELFALRTYGNIYTRIGNPTVAAFEEKLASLEGGLGAVATASGLSAQLITILSVAQSGDHLVASANLYGGTVTQFSVTLKRMGIETTFVAPGDLDAVRAALQENTRALFVETIGNPNGNVADIAALAGDRARGGRPARRRQHVRDAVPVPARSSTAPTSWCTRRRSSSAGTAP